MRKKEKSCEQIIEKAQAFAGVKDVLKVFERFQEAYTVTEHYLDLISPKTHQSNSNQSFLTEIK